MPRTQTDPTRLEGDDLQRWYSRNPGDIERERQEAANQRHQNYFGVSSSQEGADQSLTSRSISPTSTPQDEVLWVANGRGGYRAVRSGQQQYFPEEPAYPAGLPNNAAEPEGGELFDIGNPHNPRLRREWERSTGKSWPRTDDGQRFHVSHKVAIADGGTNTLDNIEPMHPKEHVEQHMKNGDFRRWALRARPRISPPPGVRGGGTVMRGLGLLGFLPTITGLLSGRIEMTDDPVANAYHLFGYPAPGEVPEEPLIT